MPGVVAVLTGADLMDIDPYFGHVEDRPIVAIDRVRHVGEPVAVVAAVDEATAEAVAAIGVEYEELPVVGTIGEALAPGAPLSRAAVRPGLFHGLTLADERDGNVCYRYAHDDGDVDGAFATAPIVVEGHATRSRASTSTRWRRTRSSRRRTARASRSGRPASTRSSCARRSPTSSACRSRGCASSCRTSAAFSSKSYTKMEPVTVAMRARPDDPSAS